MMSDAHHHMCIENVMYDHTHKTNKTDATRGANLFISVHTINEYVYKS